MQEKEKNISFDFTNFRLLYFIYRKKNILLIISIIAIIFSLIASSMIEPLYKSTLIFFPAHTSSISKSFLSTKVIQKERSAFGEKEELDQFLQILYADEIKDKIIKKYNLMQHYQIDTLSDYPKTQLSKEFDSKITYSRTHYRSLKVEVFDTNPNFSANIANDIASYLDTIINNMQKKRSKEAFYIVETEYFNLKKQIKILEDSIQKIRKKGVFDYESQSEVFNKEYAVALANGNKKAIVNLEEKLEILANYGGAYISIRDLLLYEIERLSMLKAKYMEAKVDAEKDLPHKYIVNKAVPAEKKSYPIRWLIVVITSFSTFLISLFCLILLENLKKNIIYNEKLF